MSYIGKTPQIGGYHKLDPITCDGSTSYTMQLNSSNFSPESVNHMIVSVNGVIQAPTTSYTISSSTITFASALTSSDTIDFIMCLGNVLDIGTPSDGTVSLSKLSASGTKDATTYLRGDNTFATISAGITEADQWRLSADLTTATGVETVLSSNLERIDTSAQGYLGTGMTQSSGVFTFPSTGIWLVSYGISTSANVAWTYLYANIQTTTDNSTYTSVSRAVTSSTGTMSGYPEISSMSQTLVDVTSTSLVKVRFVYNTNVAITIQGNSNYNKTFFTFIRLGDT